MSALAKYSMHLIWSLEDEAYVATSPEFPGLSGVDEVPERAIAELRLAMDAVIAAFKSDGTPIPQPIVIG